MVMALQSYSSEVIRKSLVLLFPLIIGVIVFALSEVYYIYRYIRILKEQKKIDSEFTDGMLDAEADRLRGKMWVRLSGLLFMLILLLDLVVLRNLVQ